MSHAKVLEGMHRHASIHAAGVVIAPGDLTDYVPLYRSSTGDVTSQYDMKGLDVPGNPRAAKTKIINTKAYFGIMFTNPP